MLKKSALLLLVFTAACVSPEELAIQKAAQDQADVNTCLKYGMKPGSEAFANCRLQLDLARQERYYRSYDYHPHPHFNYHHWH